MSTGAKTPPKWVLKAMVAVNVFVYRVSGGRLWNSMGGSPICLVTMTGRKSGRLLTRPLMYTAHGQDVLLVASLAGAATNPVWYYNIVAHPEIAIQVGAKTGKFRARQASPDEKAQLWPTLLASYPAFASYQDATDRDIPVLVCEPAQL